MKLRPHQIVFLAGATAGLFFACFSTFDFVQHLDRQVHDLHCSFVPGLVAAETSGESGCAATLMSPYSSVLRTSLWGGLPISLPGIAMFAFLLYRGIDGLGRTGDDARARAKFLALAALLPVLTSLLMGYISLHELNAACKLCIGIYGASVVCFVAALLGLRAPAVEEPTGTGAGSRAADLGAITLMGGGQLGLFVAVPALMYVSAMPDYTKYVGQCGELLDPSDPYGVMVPLGGSAGAGVVPAIEVFDPLCPACRGFERRLTASGLGVSLERRAVMFPLDDTCNWMVSHAMHPGACAVSEAVLCAEAAGVGAKVVISWAFENQEKIRQDAARDPKSAGAAVLARFPAMKTCLGSPEVKAKLNRSLRWAVTNRLPLMTPQLYVNGKKLCDEDTDLGMDFALSRLIESEKGQPIFAGGAAKGTAAGKLGAGAQGPEPSRPSRPATAPRPSPVAGSAADGAGSKAPANPLPTLHDVPEGAPAPKPAGPAADAEPAPSAEPVPTKPAAGPSEGEPLP